MAHFLKSGIAVLFVLAAVTGCSDDDGSEAAAPDATPTTGAATSESRPTEATSTTTAAPPTSDAPTTQAPTTVPTTVETTTTTEASLPSFSITQVSSGAGSGEFDARIEPAQSGVDHFRVSVITDSTSERADIIFTQESGGGTLITFMGYEGEEPVTFAVSYAHVDGRDSTIAYIRCNQAVSAGSPCTG